MRRKDREVKEIDDIESIIAKCSVIRIGFVDKGFPYIVPLNFGYLRTEGQMSIFYFHCAKDGRKLELIKENDNVCFELDCSLKIIEDETACEWSSEYESVIGSGVICIVDEINEKTIGMHIIMGKYGFKGVPSYEHDVFARTTILKLSVTEMSGKRSLKQN